MDPPIDCDSSLRNSSQGPVSRVRTRSMGVLPMSSRTLSTTAGGWTVAGDAVLAAAAAAALAATGRGGGAGSTAAASVIAQQSLDGGETEGVVAKARLAPVAAARGGAAAVVDMGRFVAGEEGEGRRRGLFLLSFFVFCFRKRARRGDIPPSSTWDGRRGGGVCVGRGDWGGAAS
jgi:hypothetical protein